MFAISKTKASTYQESTHMPLFPQKLLFDFASAIECLIN